MLGDNRGVDAATDVELGREAHEARPDVAHQVLENLVASRPHGRCRGHGTTRYRASMISIRHRAHRARTRARASRSRAGPVLRAEAGELRQRHANGVVAVRERDSERSREPRPRLGLAGERDGIGTSKLLRERRQRSILNLHYRAIRDYAVPHPRLPTFSHGTSCDLPRSSSPASSLSSIPPALASRAT